MVPDFKKILRRQKDNQPQTFSFAAVTHFESTKGLIEGGNDRDQVFRALAAALNNKRLGQVTDKDIQKAKTSYYLWLDI